MVALLLHLLLRSSVTHSAFRLATTQRWYALADEFAIPASGEWQVVFQTATGNVHSVTPKFSGARFRRLTPLTGITTGTPRESGVNATSQNALNLRMGASVNSNATRALDLGHDGNGNLFMRNWQGNEFAATNLTATIVETTAIAEASTGGGGGTGPQGPIGPEGPAGADGSDGADGQDGAPGATGPRGPDGTPGVAGGVGAQGPAGQDGSDGTDGATGPRGPAGQDGTDGARGPEGPAGPAGSDGAAGDDGNDGAAGAAGAQGPIGPEGPIGPAGADGADGVDSGELQHIEDQLHALQDGIHGTEDDITASVSGTVVTYSNVPVGNWLYSFESYAQKTGLFRQDDNVRVAVSGLLTVARHHIPDPDQREEYYLRRSGMLNVATAGNIVITWDLGGEADDTITTPANRQSVLRLVPADSDRYIPPGGTDGQVLTKASGNDYDVDWETVAGGTGGTGPQGPIGPEGPAGPAGDDGNDGSPGAAGAQGPIGPEGPIGPAGADGADGATVTTVGSTGLTQVSRANLDYPTANLWVSTGIDLSGDESAFYIISLGDITTAHPVSQTINGSDLRSLTPGAVGGTATVAESISFQVSLNITRFSFTLDANGILLFASDVSNRDPMPLTVHSLPLGGAVGGGGGGGGGGFATHLVGSGRYLPDGNVGEWPPEAGVGDIILDDSDWFLVNLGGADDLFDPTDGDWKWVRGDVWRGLTAGTVGATRGAGQGMQVSIVGESFPGVAFLGRTAANRVLLTSEVGDVNPLTIRGFNEISVAANFLDLSDTPAAFGTAGQVPVVNTDGDGLVFADQSGGGYATTEIGSGNFDITVFGRWATEANSTVITLDGSDWFLVNQGDTRATWYQIRGDQWRGIEAGVYGGAIDTFIEIPAQSESSDHATFLGRTADNKVLVSGTSSGGATDLLPLTIRAFNEGSGSGGGGASSFVDLMDTPDALGTAGQVAVVNADGDGLIFEDQATSTEGPAGQPGPPGRQGPPGESASDTRVEIHRGTLTTEEGRSGGRWRGIETPAVCPESGILRFYFTNSTNLNSLSSEVSAAEIRALDPIVLGATTQSTSTNSKSIRASANVRSNATRMIAIARTAENHLLFLQWQGNEFRGVNVVVYQHGAPQPEVLGDNFDVIIEENSARETRVDVPAQIRRVFNAGFPNVMAPAGNTLLVNLSVGTRSNALQGEEIEIWVNGAVFPDVSFPAGGSAVDFELDDTHRSGTTWTIEARTTTSSGGQLENVEWTYEVVRFHEDYEILTGFTHVDTVLRQEISANGFWRTLTNRPVILEDYSDFVVEARDARNNGVSIERHWLHREDLLPHLTSTPPSGIHSPGAHSVLLDDTGETSMVSQFSNRTRPSSLARVTFFFGQAVAGGPVTEIRGVAGTGGLNQVASFGDISIRIRGRRKGTS